MVGIRRPRMNPHGREEGSMRSSEGVEPTLAYTPRGVSSRPIWRPLLRGPGHSLISHLAPHPRADRMCHPRSGRPFHRIFMTAMARASCPDRMLGTRHRRVPERERKSREMMNRKGVTWAIAGLALAGALVGGAGIAVAATGTPQPSPSSTSSVDPPYGHLGGMAGTGDMGDMTGMAFGENSPMAAAADYLGLSLTDLRAELKGGQSLADVSAAHGKSVSGLEDAMIAAMTSHLDANTTFEVPHLLRTGGPK